MPDFLLNINVQDACTFGLADLAEVPSDTAKMLQHDGLVDDEDDEHVWLSLSDIQKYNIEDCIIDYMWDDDMQNCLVDSVFPKKRSGKVLLLANSCTWDHRSGYNIVDAKDMFIRSYDVNQTVLSSNGKVCKIRESSHDVPMGYIVLAVSLTKRELNMANWDRKTFGEMYAWAEAL